MKLPCRILSDRRIDHERRRDVDQVQRAEHQGDLLPSPIAALEHHRPHESHAPMTVTTGGTPKMLSAAVIPMNSVIIVSQSTSTRSSSENHPQNDPKAWKMASAWPRLVTAPKAHRHLLDVVGDWARAGSGTR